jgi:hypothetical protein
MDLVHVVLVAVPLAMAVAIVLDRTVLTAAAPVPGRAVPVPPPTTGEPGTDHTIPAPVPPAAWASGHLRELAARAEGWALLGPGGTVVATNLPERAALLASACAALRRAPGAEGMWRTVTLEGPAGLLLGEAGPSGRMLAVLARPGADLQALRRAMRQTLAELEAQPPAGSEADALAGDRVEPGEAPPGAYLPLD